MTREEVKDIARIAGLEAAQAVIDRHEEHCPVVTRVVKAEIKAHIESCPIAQKMEIRLYRLLLYLTASGAVGGSAVAVIQKLFDGDAVRAAMAHVARVCLG